MHAHFTSAKNQVDPKNRKSVETCHAQVFVGLDGKKMKSVVSASKQAKQSF